MFHSHEDNEGGLDLPVKYDIVQLMSNIWRKKKPSEILSATDERNLSVNNGTIFLKGHCSRL